VPTTSPTVALLNASSAIFWWAPWSFPACPAQRRRVVRFGILADDLTGADATASLLKREGLPTSGIVTQAQELSTREAFDPSIKRYRAPAAST
jgi:hypothetical protein